ncbi:hypothetical protein RDV64_16735 [Acuticoccus sp. MNP-M23]|uniref:PepSY domain-containing protein n=1 Tax=Acuticoccus sp. MNP-M23 TaxID=3072793 RepID=UPI00281565A3|nr:hypothetical protein [Acuticoccus sp. MNP-M23]WMS41707.1 hypothetical protein RDV64_16735 [Acuticoccus sp. MNP-M23]
MRKTLGLILVFMLLAWPAALSALSAPAGAQAACLNRHDQREAISSGKAIRPAEVRRKISGKVLRLQLCQTAGGLVWQVTTLRLNGRVLAQVLDARSGRKIR